MLMDLNLRSAVFNEETGEVVLEFRDALPVGHPNPVDWRPSKSVFLPLPGVGTLVPDVPEPAPEPEGL